MTFPHTLVVLMYHALYATDSEFEALDPIDRPYAVSVSRFGRQLDLIADAGLPVVDPSQLGREPLSGVLLTFDDGHDSALRHAAPELQRRGLRGAFFVTTGFIGARRGFCTWRDLRDLVGAGMTVGGHGHTHRFLDDLPDEQAAAEILLSRQLLGEHLGVEAQQMSFPGGRYRLPHVVAGVQAGFDYFHSSRVGAHGPIAFTRGSVLSRVAVRATDRDEHVRNMAAAARWPMVRARAASSLKRQLRRFAGNRLYHHLYEYLAR